MDDILQAILNQPKIDGAMEAALKSFPESKKHLNRLRKMITTHPEAMTNEDFIKYVLMIIITWEQIKKEYKGNQKK